MYSHRRQQQQQRGTNRLRLVLYCIVFTFLVSTIAVLGHFVVRFGWVRVRGQIERHVFMPMLRVEQRKLLLPRYTLTRLDIFVISVARAQQRREAITKQLNGVPFTLVDAVDGSTASFDEDELVAVVGLQRMRESGFDSKECRANRRACPMDPESLTARNKIALDVTYYRLFSTLSKSSAPAIVLEDDADLLVPGFEFRQNVLRAIRSLPNDWDLLLLMSSSRFTETGLRVSPYAQVLRSGAGTVGFVVTPALCRYFVTLPLQALHALPIDLVLCGLLPETGRINAYLAMPHLVAHGVHSSLIANG
jgi:GR25 family glycosyltransferase involved in LPS biosynthesis